ncbi:glycerate kinase [Agrilus planipennis]|uniref:Glycerate kinase n=1 Tax=Agrilus planipennis TaxID=224129 RepID=A0A1W4WW36_AGRPL|nr:glycerate kinase [Agrilus planipennis]
MWVVCRSLHLLRQQLSRNNNVNKIHRNKCDMEPNHLTEIFQAAVGAVNPISMIRETVKVCGSHLCVADKTFPLHKPCYVVGFGKAVLGMAVELEKILGPHLKTGIINVPVGIFETFREKPELLPDCDSKLQFIEGAKDNLPDENALKGAIAIKNLAQQLKEEDLLIVLISGGGSALLPLPKQTLKLHEKLQVIKNLTRRGADIKELNCVRKKLSAIKGGGLARIAYPAKVVSLILSDIVGDSLDSIASGPTTPDWNPSNAAWEIIEKYSLSNTVPDAVKDILLQSDDALGHENGLYENGKFAHVYNLIVGNNRKAACSALKAAKNLGYEAAIISTKIEGLVDNISNQYALLAKHLVDFMQHPENSSKRNELKLFLKSLQNELGVEDSAIDEILSLNFKTPLGICIIGAGEPTVVVKSDGGKGGRNQELTLRFSLEVNKFNLKSAEISFLSCGTDGIDGPTDAAGAFGRGNLVQEATEGKICPVEFLLRSDSYTFFSKFNDGMNLIKMGHTGTNVMDIHVMILHVY